MNRSREELFLTIIDWLLRLWVVNQSTLLRMGWCDRDIPLKQSGFLFADATIP